MLSRSRTILTSFRFSLHFGAVLLVLCAGVPAQAQPVGQRSGMQSGGAVTGETHAPVHDALNRPITAGGFVPSGPVYFRDNSKQSGLTSWQHDAGTEARMSIVESLGGGVGFIDYDNDGWLDIYLVNSSSFGAMKGNGPAPKAALFHNNHDGTFTNVAEKAGVTNERWGVGAVVADYDNDGWPDIYVTNVGANRLYHNNHDGTFTDLALKAGVALGGWSTGATFGDYDGDGRLDLFVPGYAEYDFENPPVEGSNKVAENFCRFRGARVFCGPKGIKGASDHLFHNKGDGTFEDVSVAAGVSDRVGYFGLVSLFVDLDGDGRPDLLVANDSTPNYLYRNKGNGKFVDESFESGFAVNARGRETATMGIAVGDVRNNGILDILTTDFSDDYKVLYRNEGEMSFNDVSYEAGIANETVPFLSWGDALADFDNDGWKDIFIADGHVYPQVDAHDWGTSFAQRQLLFRNVAGKKFVAVPAVDGSGLATVVSARGAAFGDLFNDGKIDVVLNVVNGAPVLLRNVSEDKHHWLELKLVGAVKSPRDAIGATVTLTTGKMTQRGDVLSGGSFASSNDPRVHFGLGDAASIDSMTVRWPDGLTEKIVAPAVDRIYTVEEGKGVVSTFAPEK